MASQAYGRLVSADDEFARYDYGIDHDDPRRGTVVIPVRDPESWFMAGRDDRPRMALSVVARAVREFERTGAWPRWASVFTG
jgi:hypothetical protein